MEVFEFSDDFKEFDEFQDFFSLGESDISTDIDVDKDMEKYEKVTKVEIFKEFDWNSSQEVNEMSEDEVQDFIINTSETVFEEGYWIAKSKDRYFY